MANLFIILLKTLLRNGGNFLHNVKHLQHTWGNDLISAYHTTNEAFSCSLRFILRLEPHRKIQQFEKKNWSMKIDVFYKVGHKSFDASNKL